MKRIAAIIILIITAVGCFTACRSKDEPAVYTVSFDLSYCSVNMSFPADVQVEEGKRVDLPTVDAEPTPGKVFQWTKDPVGKEKYDAAQPVSGNMTLYLVEVPKQYTITYLFEIDGVVNSTENRTLFDGTEAVELYAPTLMPFGYKFIKWCYPNDKNSKVESIPVGTRGDVVLRAYIIPVVYDVVITDLNGATNPNAAVYSFGDEMTLDPPDEEGFVCYVAHEDATLVVDKLTPSFIIENQESLFNGGYIYLRAKWSN